MTDNIKVAIRVRPLIKSETENNAEILWNIKDNNTIKQISSTTEFTFDRVFQPDEDNVVVYKEVCLPIVNSVMQGFNGTIFAYGQTSSGKTYTMMGEYNGIVQGLIHYTISDIFTIIQEMPEREFLLRVSFLEIYNEKVFDLLSKSDKIDDLRLLEDGYGNIKVNGLKEQMVQTYDQILEWLRIGQDNRKTAETKFNKNSSRSHSIFRMIIESKLKDEENAVVNVSQLNLIDLAGSEDVSQATISNKKENQYLKIRNDRFTEGTNINLSLLELQKVISQLSQKKETQFIAYRNSKLTRLLQNSLGGNALTAIICTVTPISKDSTRSTLYFAKGAKNIKNRPRKNEVLGDQPKIKQLEKQIKKLNQQLKKYETKEQGKELEEKTKENENLKRQIEALKANFVTQIVPARRNKAIRRETWGGHIHAHLFPRQANVAIPRNLMLDANLPSLEEEPEVEANITEYIDSTLLKSRKSSLKSPKRIRISNSLKKVVHVQTQTDFEINKFIAAHEDAMKLVPDLKNQLKSLQNEYEELTEYTTLEKQYLKAEKELLQDVQVLKQKNEILKDQLVVTMRKMDPEDKKKMREHLMFQNISIISDEKKLNAEMVNSSFAENSLNNAFFVENSKLNNYSIKQETEINQSDINESSIMDETSKSQFLALYDECFQNEVISKLKEDLEMLRYDNDLKDKQITILRDKLEIKEQMISSLNDEITLNKAVVSNAINKADANSLMCSTEFEFHHETKIKVLSDAQTSPLQDKLFTGKHYIDQIEANDQISQTDLKITYPKITNFVKETQTSDLCFIQNANKNEVGVQTFVEDFEFNSQTKKYFNNFQTSLFCKETCVQNCQTDFECERIKPSNCDKECQVLINMKCTKCDKIESLEYLENVANSSNDEDETRTSPLKEYLSETQDDSFKKELKHQMAQTTPLIYKGGKHFHNHTNEKSIQTLLMSDQLTNILIDTNVGFVERSDLKFDLNEKKKIRPNFLKTDPSPKISTIAVPNQSDDIKVLIDQISKLRSYTYNFMKNSVKSEFMEGIDDFVVCNKGCPFSVAEQEVAALQKLILRLEFCVKNIMEYSELLNDQLESKFEEVITLDLQFSEVKNTLGQKEIEFSNLSEQIFKLKGSLSQLIFVCGRVANIESVDELKKIKLITIPDNFQYSIPSHELTLMQNMVSKLHSHVEENAEKIISLSENFKNIENELSNLKKKSLHYEIENISKSTQTIITNSVPNSSESSFESGKELFKCENEIEHLKQNINQLENQNKYLEQNLKDLNSIHSTEICILNSNHERASAEWELKTKMLLKDMEIKYEREIVELEEKFSSKFLELKKEHIRDISKKEMDLKATHNKELMNAKQSLENRISELIDRLSNEDVEKINFKTKLEEEKNNEVLAVKKKQTEISDSYLRKLNRIKDLYFQSEIQNKQYVEDIKKLELEVKIFKEKSESSPDNSVLQSLKLKLNTVINEREIVMMKYSASKKLISDLEQKLDKLKKDNGEIQKLTDNETKKFFEETKEKLLNELDQKKAKITSLESNNGSMITEIKRLKDMLASKTCIHCKCKNRGSKSEVSEKPAQSCENTGKNKIDNVTTQNLQENLNNKKMNQGDKNTNEYESQENYIDQDQILSIGGGSGPANQVKCYWLQGKLHKKEKEINQLKKEIDDLNLELKTLKSCPKMYPEKKRLSNKDPEATAQKTSDHAINENITVYNAALHPYQQGAIPKTPSKQILKEKNCKIARKPYDNVYRTNHVHKPSDESNDRKHESNKPQEPISNVDVAKMLVGESECKQQ